MTSKYLWVNKITLSILCCHFVVHFLSAQTSNSSGYFYKKSLETKHVRESDDYLKTDICSIIEGDIPILYERSLSDDWALEGGAGLILPYTFDIMSNVFPLAKLNPSFDNHKFGYSCLLQPKMYASYYQGLYLFIPLRLRNYSNVALWEAGLGAGYPFFLGKMLMQVELNFVFGYQVLHKGATDNDYKYGNYSESEYYTGTTAEKALYGKFGLALKLGLPVK